MDQSNSFCVRFCFLKIESFYGFPHHKYLGPTTDHYHFDSNSLGIKLDSPMGLIPSQTAGVVRCCSAAPSDLSELRMSEHQFLLIQSCFHLLGLIMKINGQSLEQLHLTEMLFAFQIKKAVISCFCLQIVCIDDNYVFKCLKRATLDNKSFPNLNLNQTQRQKPRCSIRQLWTANSQMPKKEVIPQFKGYRHEVEGFCTDKAFDTCAHQYTLSVDILQLLMCHLLLILTARRRSQHCWIKLPGEPQGKQSWALFFCLQTHDKMPQIPNKLLNVHVSFIAFHSGLPCGSTAFSLHPLFWKYSYLTTKRMEILHGTKWRLEAFFFWDQLRICCSWNQQTVMEGTVNLWVVFIQKWCKHSATRALITPQSLK